ncbi:SDR family NAD(P)-dependent oxidoreductase [Micromonospora sp. LOL_014]|uniref:SDR family NAD(P)-dependent oxidoreductase n=1 Tax=Micromonospora sp. LOL_014 TaxID=3345415 RepID=UPI003A8AAC7C
MIPHNDPSAGPPAPIAVVGMSCRLPGADGIAEFWALLRRGGTAFSGVPEERRRDWPPDALPPADVGTDPQGGFLTGVDRFDAAFFGISPREAAALDPQHRLMLELAWEALEDSGQPRQRWAGRRAGVFVGAIADDYAALVHRAGPAAVDRHTFTGLQRGLIANRVSRLLGLTGPSLTVDAGQCSSLLAVHLACEQLWAGDVDLALAGGVHLNLAPDGWLAAARFGVLSRSGASVPFDTAADGFRRGEGGGLVVLKPLRLAEADGDDIYCVVLGGATNNDGDDADPAVPAVSGQEAVLRRAYRRAGVSPADVQYVELHGTGTRRGDRVEATALGAVVGLDRPADQPARVGSVKANIGHLEGAAGIAGLVKTALSIRYRGLPAHPGRTGTGPATGASAGRADDGDDPGAGRLPLADLGLRVQPEYGPWPVPERLPLAGVSSFGIGGTNCHLVLAGVPLPAAPPPRAAVGPAVVCPLSARSDAALRAQADRLHRYLVGHPEVDPRDVACSLATTRTVLPVRAAVVAADRGELLAGLAAVAAASPAAGTVAPGTAPSGGYAEPVRLAHRHVAGDPVDWPEAPAVGRGRRIRLPSYPYQRERHWLPANNPPAVNPPTAQRPVVTSPAASRPAANPPCAPRPLPVGLGGLSATLAAVRRHAATVLGHPDPAGVDPELPFRELGLDSLGGEQLRDRLAAETGLPLVSSLIYDHPTPQRLARHLADRLGGTDAAGPNPDRPVPAAAVDEPLAIVGMACRYPGDAESPDELWRILVDGADVTGDFPTDRGWDVDRLYDPTPGRPGRTYTRRGGFLTRADRFDADFFGISPREALAMDPQQRLLLEVGWETLESAGIDPTMLRGERVGVFVGATAGDYGPRLHEAPDQVRGHLLTGTSASLLSGRLSYVLGFDGPAVTVDTACSSSLVALHQAARAVRAGECPLALAGGVAVMSTPGMFLEFSQQRGLSPDGRCRAFAAGADGTAWSEGVGLVLLEPLSRARRLGHPVLALLVGSAVNQDGASNGLTAPHGPAQERVVRGALAAAGLRPDDIDAVEAHGTGTRLGDPVEATALLAVHAGRDPDRPVRLGSLKANVGHSQAAAGIGGVLKMILAMRYGMLPVTPHLDEPTPLVDWSAGTVRLLTEPVPWPPGAQPRRAGVSSFGISGTNAHVILQEAPTDEPGPARAATAPAAPLAGMVLWPLSARTPQALAELAGRLHDRLAASVAGAGTGAGDDPADVGHALATGRASLSCRAVVVGDDREELLRSLAALRYGEPAPGLVQGTAVPGGTAFLFPGPLPADETARLASIRATVAGLARRHRVFAEALRQVAGHLDPYLPGPLLTILTGDPDPCPVGGRHRVADAVLFAGSLAAHQLVTDLGLQPDVLFGEGVGEVAAAHAAGMLALSDACRLAMALSDLTRPADATPTTDPTGGAAVPADYAEVVGSLTFAAPRLPVVSPLTGAPVPAEVITTAGHWLRYGHRPVDVAAGLQRLTDDGIRRYLELVAGSAPAGRFPAGAGDPPPLVLPVAIGDVSGAGGPAIAVARMYCAGATLRPVVPPDGPVRRPVALPTYPFQGRRYWLEPSTGPAGGRSTDLEPTGHPLLGAVVELPDTGDVVATARLGPTEQPWLADHVVDGAVLVPGAVFVEWALRLAGRFGAGAVAELVLESPLLVAPGAAEVRLVLRAAGADGRRRLTVHSRPAADPGGRWTRHASALLGDPAADAAPTAPTAPTGSQPVDIGQMYVDLAGRGFDYGPRFRVVRRLRIDGDELSGELDDDPADSGYGVHPAVLDGALQAVLTAEASSGTPLPFAWHGVRQLAATTGRLRLYGRRLAPLTWSLLLADGAGRPVLTVASVIFRPVAAGTLAAPGEPARPVLLRPVWRSASPSVAPAVSGRWSLLGADYLGLTGAVKSRLQLHAHASLHELDDELRAGANPPEVVLVCGVDDGDGERLAASVRASAQRIVALVQSWIADESLDDSRLVVVTRGAVATEPGDDADPAGAAVWGVLRGVRAEYPDRFLLVDVDDGDDSPGALAEALADAVASGEPEQAVRSGRRLLPGLEPVPRLTEEQPAGAVDRAVDPVRWSTGTVLLTGGTGAVGSLLAGHLVDRHAVRHLVLVSRRGPDAPGVAELVARLAATGAEVRAVACDVIDPMAVRRLLAEVPPDRPVRAVVHAAGVVDDGTVNLLTPRRLDRVLRSKVDAAVRLAELLPDGAPDADLVLFSSVIGLTGGAGQANYAAANAALDALAYRWHRAGRRTLSLAWGLWGLGSGMGAALSPTDLRRMERAGLAALSAEQGLALFDEAVRRPEPVLVPVRRYPQPPGHRRTGLARLLPETGPSAVGQSARQRSGRLAGDPAEVAAGQPDDVRATLAGLAPRQREEHLVGLVQQHVAEVLGHGTPEAVGVDRELWDVGFDSLTTVELGNRLTLATGLRLPLSVTFENTTVRALARQLARLLEAP